MTKYFHFTKTLQNEYIDMDKICIRMDSEEKTKEKALDIPEQIMEKYRKGVLGALPDPELIRSLLDIKGNL